MEKFVTYICGPVTLVESEKPETVVLIVGTETVELTKQDFRDLCDCAGSSYSGVKFVYPPRQEPAILDKPQPDVYPALVAKEEF